MDRLLYGVESTFDFSPYIEKTSTVPAQKTEKKTKTNSKGYEDKTFGTEDKTVLSVLFKSGLPCPTVSAILSAIESQGAHDVYEYWDVTRGLLRKADFFARPGQVDIISLADNGYCDEFTVEFEQCDTATDIDETTVEAFPITFSDVAGSWSNEANAYANDTAYATNAGVTNVAQTIYFSGFDFSSIPEGSKIVGVEAEIKYKVSAEVSIKVGFGAAYKGTERGTLLPVEDTPLSDYVISNFDCGKWTLAEIQSANCQLKLWFKRYVSAACTMSLNYVKLKVKYRRVG